jgi:DNA-binding PadR family transcriptional regulator
MFGNRHLSGHHVREQRFGGNHCGGRGSGGHGGESRHGHHHRGSHGERGHGGLGFGRGGGGGRGGRFFGPGDLRLVLLALIEEKPRHGYELIKELEAKFGGAYSPSPGSVYPTLTLLEELGHVRSTTEGAKRLVEITPEGSQYVRDNQAALDSAKARMEMAARAASGEMPPAAVHHAMHTLKAALMYHRNGWDAAETERVRQLIEAAAAAIDGGRGG